MKKTSIWIGISGLLFLLVYILAATKSLTYDEPYYLSNIELIRQYGWGRDFIAQLKGPAGPLYAYLHAIIEPITGQIPVNVRLVNVILAALIIYFLYKLINHLNGKGYVAFLFMAIPMSYPTVGMALTEIPAMFAFSLSIFILDGLYKKGSFSISDCILGLISGGLFSLAISGRQPYLLSLAPFALIFFSKLPVNRKKLTAIFLASALAYPFYLFSIWGGLTPKTGGEIANTGGFSLTNFMLSLGYASILMALLAPDFFIRLSKRNLVLYSLFFALTLVVFKYTGSHFAPLHNQMQGLLSDRLFSLYQITCPSLLALIGIYFLHSCWSRMLEKRENVVFIVCLLMLLAILFSCIKVTHQFSSRYVFQAAPLFLIVASFYIGDRLIHKLPWVIGLIIGIISITAYY